MTIARPPVRKLGEFSRQLPAAYQAVIALGNAAVEAGLDEELLELIKIRASQINGCAFCLAMHLTEARRSGVARVKLDMVAVWREAGIYSEREIAALAWTEAVTLIAGHGVPDEVDELARRAFTPLELAALTAAVCAINVWNRINVSYRTFPEFED